MQDDLYPRWFNKLPTKSHSVTATEANPYPKLIAWLIFLLLVFLFFNSLWTWFSISVLADENTVRGYLQEVAGPESVSSISETTNQEYVKGVANSALQTALFIFLLTIPLVFAWLRFRKK